MAQKAQAAAPGPLLTQDGRVQRKFDIKDHLVSPGDKNFYDTLPEGAKLFVEIMVVAKINTHRVGYGSLRRCATTNYLRSTASIARHNLVQIFEDSYVDTNFINVRCFPSTLVEQH